MLKPVHPSFLANSREQRQQASRPGHSWVRVRANSMNQSHLAHLAHTPSLESLVLNKCQLSACYCPPAAVRLLLSASAPSRVSVAVGVFFSFTILLCMCRGRGEDRRPVSFTLLVRSRSARRYDVHGHGTCRGPPVRKASRHRTAERTRTERATNGTTSSVQRPSMGRSGDEDPTTERKDLDDHRMHRACYWIHVLSSVYLVISIRVLCEGRGVVSFKLHRLERTNLGEGVAKVSRG